MTPSDFNQHLLQAKDTALDTLEDLCAPAFPKRSRIPTTRDDGTLIPYEEQLAMSRAQPPRLNPDEQHVIVTERNVRVRAASMILKTRPIGDDGNPLPISPRHPQHHTRSRPRSTNPEQERAGSTDRDSTSPECERVGAANRPEGAPLQPAGSPAGTAPENGPRSGGPTNPPDNTDDEPKHSSALRAEHAINATHRQVNLPADIARPLGETNDSVPASPPSTHSTPSTHSPPDPQSEFHNPQPPHAPP